MRHRGHRDADLHDQTTERIPILDYRTDFPAVSAPPDRPRPAYRLRRLLARRPRAPSARQACRIVAYLTGLVQGLLIVRFVFHLIGANAATLAVQWVDGLSQPLVFIFEDLFPTPRAGPFSLEIYVLFAWFFYTALGFLLKRLCRFWQQRKRMATSG